MRRTRVEISYKTIVFTAIFIFSLWLLFEIRSVLLAIFISLIIMSALNPVVTAMEKIKIPRRISILILFLGIFVIFSGIIASIIPPLISQTGSLVNQTPIIAQKLGIPTIDQRVISDQLGSLPGNVARVAINTFSNIIGAFTLFVLSFYLLAERKYIHRHLVFFFGNQKVENEIEQFIDKLEHQIGGWVRGQLTLMLLIGVLTYIGLLLLKVNFALPLAILAGLFEIIPGIGPTLSMVPAVLIATSSSPITAVATIAMYFLIQQFENNIIVPKVMQKAVGVRPLIVIISLMIGFQLAGTLGVILAVPTFLVIRLILQEVYNSERFQHKNNSVEEI